MLLKPKKKREWTDDINPMLCLAKTENQNGVVRPGMTVYQHCLSTGYVADALIKTLPYLVDIGLLPPFSPLIAAIHDVGKISPSFQNKILNAVSPEYSTGLLSKLGLADYPDDIDIPHSIVSYSAVREMLGKNIAYIEGSHHGWLEDDKYPADSEIFGGMKWQSARSDFIHSLENVFGSIAEDCLDDSDFSQIQFLLGLTIVSDWISSSISLEEFGKGTEVFKDAVQKAGFIGHGYRKGLSFNDIFGFEMRPEQLAFAQSITGPGVYILEAGTGSGKTEAALYAAYRLLEKGLAGGIYFALPTTLTSRLIKKRFDSFLSKILIDENITSKLVFGNSFLYNCIFGDDFSVPSWFDSRKRMILAPFGIGTIDQALMSVISVKHSAVRTFGLAGKVVILDEVHSYDSYTGLLIENLVRQLHDLGATVFILSATLQTKVRARFLEATKDDSNAFSDSYPSVAYRNDMSDHIHCTAVISSNERDVLIVHENDEEDALDKAIDDALNGKYVLWIENTVGEAQDIYRKCRARCDGLAGVGLLHSRFLGIDRSKKESEYTQLYGKNNWNNRLSGTGFILIGTQVLEQSLDIDADVLYTRIAPIDMIFQRIGRLWRHHHEERKGEPVCHIVHPMPESVEADPSILGPSAAVYSGYILYRTIKAINHLRSIRLPNEIRCMLDAVYDETDEDKPSINKLKAELTAKRDKLQSLAFRFLAKVGVVLSDRSLPRYSEIEYKRILIIRQFKREIGKVITIDGECLDLFSANTAKEKAMISIKLEESMINVPSKYVCSFISDTSVLRLLSGFIYAQEDDLLVVLKKEGDCLFDIYGNRLDNCYYNDKVGYVAVREGTFGRS